MADAEPHHFVTSPYRPQLQSPGQPPIAWPPWLMMFEDWLLATGFPSTEAFALRRAAFLRSSLGAEGSQICYSLAIVLLRFSYLRFFLRLLRFKWGGGETSVIQMLFFKAL